MSERIELPGGWYFEICGGSWYIGNADYSDNAIFHFNAGKCEPEARAFAAAIRHTPPSLTLADIAAKITSDEIVTDVLEKWLWNRNEAHDYDYSEVAMFSQMKRDMRIALRVAAEAVLKMGAPPAPEPKP